MDGKLSAPLIRIGKALVFALSILLALSQPAYAGITESNNQTKPAWEFHVAPYLWAINMNGAVTTGGYRAAVNESFSELLQHLHSAGMVWVDGNYDQFGFFFNEIFTSLRYNTNDGPASVHAKNVFGITSAGLSYQISKWCFSNNRSIDLEPYAGFRYTENKTTINVNAGAINLSLTNNQYWTDPIIGIRMNTDFSKAWSFLAAADVGGLNMSKQYSYNVQALLGYSPQSHWTNTSFYIGYRLLDQFYSHGKGANYYNWDMKLFGPLLGIAIQF